MASWAVVMVAVVDRLRACATSGLYGILEVLDPGGSKRPVDNQDYFYAPMHLAIYILNHHLSELF